MSLMYTQLEDESPRAFEAFATYRDMGLSRSLEAVAQKVDKHISLIRRWSAEYSWVSRARMWDSEQDKAKRDANIRVVQEMAERHAKIAMRLQEKIIHRLQTLDPEELSARELAQWLETAVKIERLSRGANTESVKQEIIGAEGGAVQIEITPPTPAELSDVIKTLIESGAIQVDDRRADIAGQLGEG